MAPLDSLQACDIVIVEDSVPTAMLYKGYLENEGYTTKLFHSGGDAMEWIQSHPPRLMIQDINLPDMSGLDVVSSIKNNQLPIEIIVVTSEGSLDTAVEAMRRGGFDYIEKPFSRERLLQTVSNALQQQALSEKLATLEDAAEWTQYQGFIGASLPMQAVYRIIENVAGSDASVFITGESGTGKELCAEAIHKASRRAEGPFIALNCAAIAKDLFESEIFGHVKGAFSGAASDRQGAAESANGGTLFLDELCEMDLDLQAKLLRLIQSGTFQKVGSTETKQVDIRFVCATNRDPQEEVRQGRFREDLYYRLNVIPIQLPALSERDTDVLLIAEHLLRSAAAGMNKEFKSLAPEVSRAFLEYPWPGNIRELKNVIDNVVIMNRAEVVDFGMLPETFQTALSGIKVATRSAAPADASQEAAIESPSTSSAVSDIQPLWLTEKAAIEDAIQRCDGNVPLAAAMLGVSASTIYRKLKTWDETHP